MSDFAELHDELRRVARGILAAADGALAWSTMADAGWLGLEVPEALGGSGVTFAETAVVLEEMGRANAGGGFIATAVLGVGALLAAPPSEGRDVLLSSISTGATTVAVALGPLSDLAEPAPAFTLDESVAAWTVSGRANAVLAAPDADRLLLLALRPGGSWALVDIAGSALEIDTVPILDATRSFGDVSAAGVPVDPEKVYDLGAEGTVAAQRLVDRGALAVAIDSFGSGWAMRDRTVAYAIERRQFGRPIGSFQAVKHMCADMVVAATVDKALLDVGVAEIVRGECGLAAARAKSHVGASAVEVVGTALQLHGGIGYTWEGGIHVHLKRVMLNRSLYGSPRAQRRRIAAASMGIRWGTGYE